MVKTCLRILISLKIMVLSLPLFSQTDATMISSSSGEILLKIIDTISIMGMQNGEEYVYHLNKLSMGRLVDEAQRKKIREIMALIEPRINARDQKVKEILAEKTFSSACQNEYQAARHLYRLAAAALLTSLRDEDQELKLPHELKKLVNRLMPEITLEVPGYRIKWIEIIPGEEFELKATPLHYQTSGIRSFLLIYSNGFISFYGGDFSGNSVEFEDEKKEKIQFDNFF